MSVGRQRLVGNAGPGRVVRRRLDAPVAADGGAVGGGGRRRAPRRASTPGGSRRAPSGRGWSRGRRSSRCGRRRTPPGSGCSPTQDGYVAEPRPPAGAAALRRRARAGAARRGHPDGRRRPRPQPVRAGGARRAGSASPRGSTCTRRSPPALDEGRQLVLLTLPDRRGLDVPRRRRRAGARGLGLTSTRRPRRRCPRSRWLSAARWSSIWARSPGPSAASPRRPPRPDGMRPGGPPEERPPACFPTWCRSGAR